MTNQPKLSVHHDAIVEGLARGVAKDHIAFEIGASPTTLRRYIKTHVDPEDVADLASTFAQDTPDPDHVTREQLLEHEVKDLRQRVRRDTTANVANERIMREIEAALGDPPPRFDPPDPTWLGTGSEGFHRHVQAALFSDLHGGEVVDPAGVDGLNEYSWSIMEDRVTRWRKALLSYQAYRPYPIEELQLWWLGDMCSGSNHQELAETNEFAAAEQGVRMGHLLGELVESLVPHYQRIVVYGVAGNHPRLPAKPANKQVFNNFDWVAYKIAETKLRNYESVECNFPMGQFVVAEVAGLNVLLFHGDGIRSSMPGVPWGGVSRRVAQLKQQYAEQRGIILDGFALGHFHQANAVQNIWMNGSIKGVDEYVLKNFGSGEPPTQLLLTFDADKSRHTDVSYINPA